MKKDGTKRRIAVLASGILLVNALIFSQSALAQQDQKVQGPAESQLRAGTPTTVEKQSDTVTAPRAQVDEANGAVPEGVVERPSADGSHEGIKVHGHWTIDVRNPDGKLVTHREFENSLVAGGASLIARCLTFGCPASPVWSVMFFTAAPGTICGVGFFCTVPATAAINFNTVGNTGGFILSGTLTPSSTSPGSIVEVETLEGSGTPTVFTMTNIAPVAVAAGQIVQVSVVITFS